MLMQTFSDFWNGKKAANIRFALRRVLCQRTFSLTKDGELFSIAN